jgi:hypothetical protein
MELSGYSTDIHFPSLVDSAQRAKRNGIVPKNAFLAALETRRDSDTVCAIAILAISHRELWRSSDHFWRSSSLALRRIP